MAEGDKPITWVGSSLADLTSFPLDAKRIAGHQLRRVQQGHDPDEFKPMSSVGAGVYEIIIDTGDAFRVFYVAKFDEAVYVLHSFQKTTKKTSQHDIERGQKLYREVVEERKRAKKRESHER